MAVSVSVFVVHRALKMLLKLSDQSEHAVSDFHYLCGVLFEICRRIPDNLHISPPVFDHYKYARRLETCLKRKKKKIPNRQHSFHLIPL